MGRYVLIWPFTLGSGGGIQSGSKALAPGWHAPSAGMLPGVPRGGRPPPTCRQRAGTNHHFLYNSRDDCWHIESLFNSNSCHVHWPSTMILSNVIYDPIMFMSFLSCILSRLFNHMLHVHVVYLYGILMCHVMSVVIFSFGIAENLGANVECKLFPFSRRPFQLCPSL